MSQSFAKYPLLQKAFAEQEAIAKALGGILHPEYPVFIAGLADVMEEYLDGTPAEKQNAMVAALLLTAVPQTFDDVRRFETEYTPEIKTVVDLILAGEAEARMANPLFVQAVTTINLVKMGRVVNTLREGGVPADIKIEDVFNEVVECGMTCRAQTPPVLKETAPRLFDLNQSVGEGLGYIVFDLENRLAASSKSKPKPAQGPKPG